VPGSYPVEIKLVPRVIQQLHGFTHISPSYVLVLLLAKLCCEFANNRVPNGGDVDFTDELFKQFIFMLLPGAKIVDIDPATRTYTREPMEIPTLYQVDMLLRSEKSKWPLKGIIAAQQPMFTYIVDTVLEWQHQPLTYELVGLAVTADGTFQIVTNSVAWAMVQVYYMDYTHRYMEEFIIQALVRIVCADDGGKSLMRIKGQNNRWQVLGGTDRKGHDTAGMLAALLMVRPTQGFLHWWFGFEPGDDNPTKKPTGSKYRGWPYMYESYLALNEPHIAGKPFNEWVHRVVGYWWPVVWIYKFVCYCYWLTSPKADGNRLEALGCVSLAPFQGKTYTNWKTCAEVNFPSHIMEAFVTFCVPFLLICVEYWFMMQNNGSFRNMLLKSKGNGFHHNGCGLLRSLILTTRLSIPVRRLRNGMILHAVGVCLWPLLVTIYDGESDEYTAQLYGYGFLFLFLGMSKSHFFGMWANDHGLFAKKKDSEEYAVVSYTNSLLAIGAWYMMTWALFGNGVAARTIWKFIMVIFGIVAVLPSHAFPKKIIRFERHMKRKWTFTFKFWTYTFKFWCQFIVLGFVCYVYILMELSFDQKDSVERWCNMLDTLEGSAQVMNFGQKALTYLYRGGVAITQTNSLTKLLRFIPKIGVPLLVFWFVWYTFANWTDKYNVVQIVKIIGFEYKTEVAAAASVAVGITSFLYALSYWTNFDALDCDLLNGPGNGSLRVDHEIEFNFEPYEWRMMGAYAHICMIAVTWSTVWACSLVMNSVYGNYGYADEDE